MKFKITVFSFIALFLFLFTGIGEESHASAATYPNSSVTVKPGDMIYTGKNTSTYFVGHVGIVGDDLRVYHALPVSGGKTNETVSSFINTRFKNAPVQVLRLKSPTMDLNNVGAAARALYKKITVYDFHPYLNNFSNNYCSKFVWQAYYYASGYDITGKGYEYDDIRYILPSEIKNSTKIKVVQSYR